MTLIHRKTELTVEAIKQAEVLHTIVFPLIVPSHQEVLNSKDLDLSKSALNACYSKPLIDEKSGKEQSWLEVEFTVNGQQDLPSRKDWFFIVTDDGYLFKACFAGKKTKRLSSFEDLEIIGAWIKGRLAEWELVSGFFAVCEDRFKEGIITQEVLKSYGGDQVFLKKTNKTEKDKKGIERDVWFLSFPYKL